MNSAGIKKPRKSKKHGGAPEKQRRRKKITTGITLPWLQAIEYEDS